MSTRNTNDPLARTFRLFTILGLVSTRQPGRPVGRRELARACGCSNKTIERDIKGLQEAEVPIDYDHSERTYYLPEKGWTLPLVTMTQSDAMALALIRSLLTEISAPFPFAEQVGTALDKAMVGLSPKLRSTMQAASATFVDVGGMARDYSRAPVGLLHLAIVQRRTVEMLYDSPTSGTRRRLVDPYRLDRRDGRYFVMQAWCHERKMVLTFALDSILEASITDRSFVPKPWQSSDEGIVGGLRGGDPREIEVRFDKVVATYAVKRRWPFKATLAKQEDGSVILRGRVFGLDGIVCELLSWRRHVKVLGGPELLERMAEEARAIAALYENDEKK